ncbi:hypothetical protein HYN59_12270 [Flavobacterium album]|uniref:Uncharacterized protein n=1 Tax=Flavobacterium album TaxID=2175091 RepID=A0A2S1QZK3_9FLAO|nr:hypothetical protein HYN59_12270 [Flavobacterium album]
MYPVRCGVSCSSKTAEAFYIKMFLNLKETCTAKRCANVRYFFDLQNISLKVIIRKNIAFD